jgi:hypothetical protein
MSTTRFDSLLPSVGHPALTESPVKSAQSGHCHFLVLLENGKVLSCGSNVFGQTANLTDSEPKIRLAESLKDKKVEVISTKYYHSFFITDERKLYSCGSTSIGETATIVTDGLNGLQAVTSIPFVPTGMKNGSGFSLFVENNHYLYGCGNGDVIGGHSKLAAIVNPEKIELPVEASWALGRNNMELACGDQFYALYFAEDKFSVHRLFPFLQKQMFKPASNGSTIEFIFH